MKLPPVIAQYLQQHKSLNIEGFGRFYIDDQQAYNEDGDKPSKAQSQVRFEYTPTKPTDTEFIDFVVKETGKIRPLAIADMDSYTSLARQLLNISKPFVIEGVGTLVATTKGVLEFTPGNYEPPKINSEADKERKIRKASENYAESSNGSDYGYSSDRQNSSASRLNVKRVAALLLGLVLLGGAAWAVYEFVIKKKTASTTVAENNAGNNNGPTADTGAAKNTPVQNQSVAPAADGSTFRIVVKEIASKAEASAFLNRYTGRGHKMTMIPNQDSTLYKMKIGIARPLTDTVRVRDSIRSYYFPKEKVYIEL